MGIAEGMKDIAEDIIASYDVRVKALGDLVADTRRTLGDARKSLKGFAADRKQMSEEQAKDLAEFMGGLSKTIGNMLKGFRSELKEVASARAEAKEELRAKLTRDAKELKGYVRKKLKEFSDAHAEMSEEQRKDLASYVKGITNSVKDILNGAQDLLGGYRSDNKKAGAIWKNMAATLAKARSEGVMPRIEAGERVSAVSEVVKKRRGRPKGRRKG